MAYQAWSVVFGEQPSASKWNILGTNDAGFNDGTAIGDNAILQRHLSDGIVSNAEMKSDTFLWEKLYDSGEIGSVSDTISSGTITARKFLKVILFLIPSGNISSNLRFNNDSGANYAFNRVSGDSVSQTSIGTGNSALKQYSVFDIYNRTATAKTVQQYTVFGQASAATAAIWDRTIGEWHNTSVQITRIDAINGGSGDFAVGSRMIVLGHD